jgi:hypothetical protein
MEGYMKPEVKQMWLEALRSGKYKQGKRQLRDGNKFCCLGVLCDLSGLEYRGSGVHLPDEVMAWAGLDSNYPDVSRPKSFGKEEIKKFPSASLAELNDFGGYGFKRIANLIERYL